MIGIKNQNFGVEIEFTGTTRKKAAEALAEYFGTTAEHLGTAYDTHGVKDSEGRVWKLMRDSSIRAEKKSGGRSVSAGDEYKVEFVTPILRYEDMDTFQECIRVLRRAGGYVNFSWECTFTSTGRTTTGRASKICCPSCIPRRTFCSKPFRWMKAGRSTGARRCGSLCWRKPESS